MFLKLAKHFKLSDTPRHGRALDFIERTFTDIDTDSRV